MQFDSFDERIKNVVDMNDLESPEVRNNIYNNATLLVNNKSDKYIGKTFSDLLKDQKFVENNIIEIDTDERVDLSRLYIPGIKARKAGGIYLSNAHIGSLDFYKFIAKRRSEFYELKVMENAVFSYARFEEDSIFSRMKVIGKSIFHISEFIGNATFDNYEFGLYSTFYGSSFKKGANMPNMNSEGGLNISHVNSEEDLNISNLNSEGDVDLSGSEIKGKFSKDNINVKGEFHSPKKKIPMVNLFVDF